MMNVIFKNLLFELSIRKKQISTYVYFAMFFALSVLVMTAAGGAFKGVVVSFGLSNKVLINSPLALNLYTSLMATFGLFIIAPIFGQAVYKDFGVGFNQIVYSTPANQKAFLIGRFLGALCTMVFIFSSVGLGLFVASYYPSIQQDLLGPNRLTAYLMPYILSIVPNIFIFGSIFFLLASKVKKMAPVYISGILIFMGWMLSGQLMSDLDNKTILSLADPFGLNAVSTLTKYWSVDEQNTKFVGLESYFLLNRLFWLGIGGCAFLWSLYGFNLSKSVSNKARKKEKAEARGLDALAIKFVKPDFSRQSKFNMFWRQFKFEVSQILRSIYFQSITLAGVLYIFIVSTQVGKLMGTTTYPVTYKVLDLLGGTFNLFILIIVTFYAGEAVWRDKGNKIDQIIDAMPTPNWVYAVSKYLSLLVVTWILLFVLMCCGLIFQTFKGYTNYEVGLYIEHLFIYKFMAFAIVSALAFFVQTLIGSKYFGHGLIILYYILSTWLPSMGFDKAIYIFNSGSLPMYSDMNGYGRFLSTYLIFKAYWGSLSVILIVFSLLLWKRGGADSFAEKWTELKRRFNKKHGTLIFISSLSFIFLGSSIYYNTEVLNTYESSKRQEQNAYDYEMKFKKEYEDMAQPAFTSVKAFVDIFPYQAKMNARLEMFFENKTNKNIEKLFLKFNRTVDYQYDLKFTISDVEKHEDFGIEILTLTKPMTPGSKLSMVLMVQVDRSSFRNSGEDRKIVRNGTFINNFQYFVSVGYSSNSELSSTKTRKKYGLDEKPRMPDLDDKKAQQKRYFGGDPIEFESVVSTAGDQIAVAPGYLQKKWQEGGRNYFHYKMDQKILNFYSFLSAKYEVKRDKWEKGGKVVDIEIYYQPGHEYNLDRMILSTKMALDYFTKNFGPYQHKQYRILEFPRYASFAQAFPNTIPFSEAIGFISDVKDDDPEDIDFPFYVNAHELGHQWWAHQLIGAGVQGATMMSETFSQYSALMVMKKRYGQEKIGKFLKYELDRYLSSRSQENEKELPLFRNENQGYIHYRKGSLVMYALQDYLGEDLVNSVLKEYLNKYAYQDAPFTTSRDFLKILKAKAGSQHDALIEDLFEKITLFQNRPLEATYKKLENGKYQVELKMNLAKYYADDQGRETKVPFKQDIYIGVTDKEGKFLHLSKHPLEGGEEVILSIEVDSEPYKAGVDPLNILVDKNPDDNSVYVKGR